MKLINTTFQVGAPFPLDNRLRVNTYADLNNIVAKFSGLRTYVVDEGRDYRFTGTNWILVPEGTSGASWGSIAGNLSDQIDLNFALMNKFDVTGGVITGNVIVQGITEGYNFILSGSLESIPGEGDYVPYTGATSDLNINNKIIESTSTVGQITAATDGVLTTKEYVLFKIQDVNQKAIYGDYILKDSDHDYILFVFNGSASVTITVPDNLRQRYNAGFTQMGTGNVSFTGSGGTIINNPVGFKIKGQFYAAFIEKVLDTSTYNLLGDTKI